MKYGSVDKNLNISKTRSLSVSPSLKIDSRGYPHIAWIEQKSGNNEICYSFWDGLKWAYKDVSKISIIEDDVVSSNSMILDSYEKPVIVFSRKIANGTRLSLATYSNQWNLVNIDVDYAIGWIGIAEYNKTEISSSSSVDSLDSASSNSSRSISDLDSSSSSSFGEKGDFYVVVYDKDNEVFRVFSVSNSNWWSIGSSISASVDDYSKIKISSCGTKIAIAFVADSTLVQYNFFDLVNYWQYPSFNDLLPTEDYGSIIDMDIKGYTYSIESRFSIGWLSKTPNQSYISSAEVSENIGAYWPTDLVDYNVKVNDIDVTVDSDYIVNGYRKIGVALTTDNRSNILVLGAASGLFSLNVSSQWDESLVNIEGISNGVVANSMCVGYSTDVKLALAADAGDIYYFENTSVDDFSMVSPDMVFLSNDASVCHATFSSGVISGEEIIELYGSQVGAILSDHERPLVIASNAISSIRTADIDANEVIGSRDISSSKMISAVDVHQTDGRILIADPLNNRILLSQQSPKSQGGIVAFTKFNNYTNLYSPLDTRFDYCNGKIWIADTYNHRVFKINPVTSKVNLAILGLFYPHSLAPDLNSGGVFVKGYSDLSLTTGLISYYGGDGLEKSTFEYSSSSPAMPTVSTMAYDHSRSRLWWVDGVKIYMADTRNNQVQTYDVSSHLIIDIISISIDLSSGNAFAIVKNYHSRKYIIQVSRDNNEFLAFSYVEL